MPSLQERYDALRGAVEYPEAWKPEPGETLVGEALRWETVATKSSGDCEVLVLRTPEAIERSAWCWHAMLRYALIADKDKLSETLADGLPRKCEPGDFVAIHYRGKSTMDDGNEAASYRVAIDKPDDEPPAKGTEDDDIPF